MEQEISQYEQERRAKLQKLRELGVDPYGQRTEGVTPLKQIKESYKPEMGHDGGPVVKGAGRIILKRDMGKLSFITLRDESGDLQVGLDKKRLDENAWKVRDLLDLGDQIVVSGPLGTTNKGETTIWATSLAMASKALLPPPAKWEGLEDVELRYRQRYVDLWANPEVMKMMQLRIRVIDEIRSFLKGRGFVEVETPMMQVMHGGAAAKPFKTHHNALDIELNMRIAPELYLKRLLVGGFTKVFELNRNFRNEGISPRHNPEFTMLEAYEAYGSWETMAEMVESMVCHVAQTVFGTLRFAHKKPDGSVRRVINLAGDTNKPAGQRWRRVRMADLVEEYTGWKFDRTLAPESTVRAAVELYQVRRIHRAVERAAEFHQGVARHILGAETISQIRHKTEALSGLASAELDDLQRKVSEFNSEDPMVADRYSRALNAFLDLDEAVDDVKIAQEQAGHLSKDFFYKITRMSPAEQLIEMYEKLIEPRQLDPCFVTHVPSVIIPLARESKEDPFFADVYELAINGVEISPGYSELNDPEVQAKHFAHQVGDKEEQQKTDEDFLTALKYGMPPAGGMGMGIDRLLMMLTGAESIRDVILFPLMRPQ